jgi:hypothetical protein
MENCVFDCGKTCSALTKKKCGKCSMRKTKAELEAGRARAMDRLETLPPEQYDTIMRKYHRLCRREEVEEC